MSEFMLRGSFSHISKELRREKEILGWKEASLYHHHYACVISDKKHQLEVHHVKSFNSILNETVKELINKNVLDRNWLWEPTMTWELRELFLKKHREYGLGVVLHKKIHKEFHRLYGHDNNVKQYDEFKRNMTVERVNELMATPAEGDLICSKCNKVTEIIIDNNCLSCLWQD